MLAQHRQPRVLFMPVSTGLFHVVNCLAVAGELKERGVQVAFAVKESNREHIIRSGFSRTYSLLEAEDQSDFFSKLSVFCEPAYIERCVADELRVIRAFKPDLIVNDGRFTVGISADIARVRWASLVLPIQMPVGLTAAEKPLQTIAQKNPAAFDAWMRHVFTIHPNAPVPSLQAAAFLGVAQRYGKHFHTIQEANSLEKADSIYDLLVSPNLNLIPTFPGLSFIKTAPADMRFVGHLPGTQTVGPIERRDSAVDLPLDRKRPLIYATFGGLPGPIRASGTKFVVELIEVLAAAPVRVVVSHPEPETLPRAPNIQTTKFIPSHRVFASGAVAQVCHGGLGTLMAALAHGVPSLSFPFSLEHLCNVSLLQESGAGQWMFPDQVEPAELAGKVEVLVQDEVYRRQARISEQDIASFGGARVAADLLQGLIES